MGEPGKFSDTMTSYQWRSHVETSCSHDGMIADAVRRRCQRLERSFLAFPRTLPTPASAAW